MVIEYTFFSSAHGTLSRTDLKNESQQIKEKSKAYVSSLTTME
jgi:hypothetical protein